MLELKTKRLAAGISGSILCAKTGISRSRLSLIEQGYTKPAPEEIKQISLALDELIHAKAVMEQIAASLGWPTAGTR